jgi:hypothetical protein
MNLKPEHAKLWELAERATQGPLEVVVTPDGEYAWIRDATGTYLNSPCGMNPADARLHVACSPAAIKRLLQTLSDANDTVERQRGALDQILALFEPVQVVDAISPIEALERIEAVARAALNDTPSEGATT